MSRELPQGVAMGRTARRVQEAPLSSFSLQHPGWAETVNIGGYIYFKKKYTLMSFPLFVTSFLSLTHTLSLARLLMTITLRSLSHSCRDMNAFTNISQTPEMAGKWISGPTPPMFAPLANHVYTKIVFSIASSIWSKDLQ